jgi:N-methylhydantoinase B
VRRVLPFNTRIAAVGRTLCSMTVGGVSREGAIADYGVVLTGERDEDLVSYDAAATDAPRATRPGLAEVLFDRGPGYARLCGGVSYADVDAVGS